MIIFSVDGHLLFDGSIDSITSDDYTATVDIYETGVKTQADVSVSGRVVSESSITGTLNGAGIASGTFTLTFDPLYNRGATFDRVDTATGEWAGDVYMSEPDMATNNFDFFSPTYYDASIQKSGPVLCSHAGTHSIPDSTKNIYLLTDETIPVGLNCPPNLMVGTYTGFVSVVDGASVDDTALYAVTNGEYAHFAVMTK